MFKVGPMVQPHFIKNTNILMELHIWIMLTVPEWYMIQYVWVTSEMGGLYVSSMLVNLGSHSDFKQDPKKTTYIPTVQKLSI